jgi:hypothetical protein
MVCPTVAWDDPQFTHSPFQRTRTDPKNNWTLLREIATFGNSDSEILATA